MNLILKFLDNEKRVYSLVILLIVITLLIPLPQIAKYVLLIAVMTLVYLNMFRSSVLASTTVFRILLWLIAAPSIISIVILGYISFLWDGVEQERYFIFLFLVFFILSWVFAGYVFELNKVKAALLILNSIFTSLLAIAFLTTLDSNLSSLVFDSEIINAASQQGFNENSLIETIVKILVFPYVMSAIWAQLIVELRSLGIIRR